jgi:hypothetical protein
MIVDLSGPQGNGYVLINIAKTIGVQLNRPYNEIKDIETKMVSGDYDKLLKVLFMEYGEFIQFIKDGKRVVFIRNKKAKVPI